MSEKRLVDIKRLIELEHKINTELVEAFRLQNALLKTCKHIYDRLSDLPSASRTPEDRWNEIYEWIVDDFLPALETVVEEVKEKTLTPNPRKEN